MRRLLRKIASRSGLYPPLLRRVPVKWLASVSGTGKDTVHSRPQNRWRRLVQLLWVIVGIFHEYPNSLISFHVWRYANSFAFRRPVPFAGSLESVQYTLDVIEAGQSVHEVARIRFAPIIHFVRRADLCSAHLRQLGSRVEIL